MSQKSGKSKIVCLLLLLFLGWFGVHRFYVNKIGTGVLFIFTVGGCGVWWLVDFVRILTGGFKTKDNKALA